MKPNDTPRPERCETCAAWDFERFQRWWNVLKKDLPEDMRPGPYQILRLVFHDDVIPPEEFGYCCLNPVPESSPRNGWCLQWVAKDEK